MDRMTPPEPFDVPVAGACTSRAQAEEVLQMRSMLVLALRLERAVRA
jgi:hypothetical protein